MSMSGTKVISSNLRLALQHWDADQKEKARVKLEKELAAEREKKEAEKQAKRESEAAEQGRPAEGTGREGDERQIDEYRNAVLALAKLISYIFFLCFIFVIVFVGEDNDSQFRTVNGFKTVLEGSQFDANIYLKDVSSTPQMFKYLRVVFAPFAASTAYYNGGQYPLNGGDTSNYQGTWANNVNMALGRVRIRQVRVASDVCLVSERFEEEREQGIYVGIRKCYPGWYDIYEKKTDYVLNGTTEVWEWREHSDGDSWRSPATKLQYPPSGFWEDLPVDQQGLVRKLGDLQKLGFVDSYTRAVFVDLSFYNAQVDQFVVCRHVFEQLPTGTIVASLEIDAVPLLSDLRLFDGDEDINLRRLVAFLMEIVMYICIFLYLRRASDDMLLAGGFSKYLNDGWNLLEIANVLCFLVVVAMRFGWMLRSSQLSYEVYKNVRRYDPLGYPYYELLEPSDPEYDEYTRIRVQASLWRYGKSMLALGILINFMKAFKFVQASRHLSQFSRTIACAVAPAMTMLFIVAIMNSGFAIAFHLTFGVLEDYIDFTESFYTLSLFYLGEFDMEKLVDTAPYLGVFFFTTFSILSVIVLMTMFLKLIDVAYGEILDELHNNDVQEFGELVLAAFRKLRDDAQIWIFIKRIQRMRRSGYNVSNDDIRNHLDRWVPGKHDRKRKQLLRQIELAKKDVVEDDPDVGSDDEGPDGSDEKDSQAAEEKRVKTPVEKEVQRILKERKKERGQYPTDPVDEAEYTAVRKQVVRRFVRANDLRKLSELDLDNDEIMERIGLMQNHATLLHKMTSRVLNNVETFTKEPRAGADIPTNDEPEKLPETVEMRSMRLALEQSQQVLQTKLSTGASAASTVTERVEEALEAIDGAPQPGLPKPIEDLAGVDQAIIDMENAAAGSSNSSSSQQGKGATPSAGEGGTVEQARSIVEAASGGPGQAAQQGTGAKGINTGGGDAPAQEHPMVTSNRDLATRGYAQMEDFPGLRARDPTEGQAEQDEAEQGAPHVVRGKV